MDEQDLKKRLGSKHKYITFVDHIKAGFQPQGDKMKYYEETANRKAAEAEYAARRKKKSSGPGI